MRDASQDRPAKAKPRKSRKRVFVFALAAVVVLAGAGFYVLHSRDTDPSADSTDGPTHAVYKVHRKSEPPKLGIEYHFDRNAISDSRLLAGQLLGLTASGNLVTLDAETFAARNERVLHRRATCLGPADQNHAVVGIANGSVIRVSGQDLAVELIGQVPGVPRWIGRRKQGGTLVIAYQAERQPGNCVLVSDEGQGRTYDVGARPALFLDSKDRLWIAGADKVRSIDLAAAVQKDHPLRPGWPGVRGFVELADGDIWAFGGRDASSTMPSFVARLSGDGKFALLYPGSGKRRSSSEPGSAITHIVEDREADRILVVSSGNVVASDRTLSSWKSLDVMAAAGREPDAFLAQGQAHLSKQGLLLNLVRGGIMEVTADYARRHVLAGQNPVLRPSEIVRLADGMAIYGDGGPIFYSKGRWHPLPDPIMPPSELVGLGRSGEKDRSWVATTTIPVEGLTSYVVTKAGPPRHYIGHIHGLRDVFLTARWDGAVLTVLGREDLPIEPDDTFVTPDKQLWNVDDQALWNFHGGRWRTVMRLAPEAAGAHRSVGQIDSTEARAGLAFRSAIGEPLHFAPSTTPPFYGLPRNSASWSLVRLDSNEAGGIPLIDEIPVKVDGRRLLLRDLTIWGRNRDQLLLATDRGLCAFSMKYGNCDAIRPEGLAGDVSLFMRDGTKRLWLGGRGLWVLRHDQRVDVVHPSIPMLADTQVVALAESPDGRLVIATDDRGTLFLTVPPGWFQRPPDGPEHREAWNATRPHEPRWGDPSLVLRACPGEAGKISDAAAGELLARLRELAEKLGGRARVEQEAQFEGRPDIALRGADLEPALEGVAPLVDKPAFKGKFAVEKRLGPPGSESVEAVACPR
jgi:hypothetical protein